MPYQDNPYTGKLERGTYIGGVFRSDEWSKKNQEQIKDWQRRRNEYESTLGGQHIYESPSPAELRAAFIKRNHLPELPPVPEKLHDKYYSGCCFWQSFDKIAYEKDVAEYNKVMKKYNDAHEKEDAAEEYRQKRQFS